MEIFIGIYIGVTPTINAAQLLLMKSVICRVLGIFPEVIRLMR